MKKHFKQGTTVVFAILWIALVLALGACSPDTEPPKDTEAIRIINIPLTVNGKPVYKVYVQLSSGMTASAGYAAKGEAKLTAGQTEVTITDLKDPDGKPWKGTNWANECVVISPETVDSIGDIDAHAGRIGPSSPTVVFDWNNMLGKDIIDDANYKALYQGIIVPDKDIKGEKK
jgi:hypothetical protein